MESLSARARSVFVRFVRNSDDRRLERTVGSPIALRLLFASLARRFDPEAAAGFEGELRFELATTEGVARIWTICVSGRCALSQRGPTDGVKPDLVVRTTVADLLRLAAGELHPARALLSGRLDVAGDFGVARLLGPMFGMGSML